MHVEATTDPPLTTFADTVVVGLFQEGLASSGVPESDLEDLARSGEANPELGRVAVGHTKGRRVIVVGLGEREHFGAEEARVAAANAHARAAELSAGVMCWDVPSPVREADLGPFGVGLVEGTVLHAYRFDRYRPAPSDRQVERLMLSAQMDLASEARRAAIVADAQNGARDLGNTPGNDLPPSALADYAVGLAGRHSSLTATVLDEEAIRSAGMGAFAAVAQGSAQEGRLIRLDYEPRAGSGSGPRLGFVGKGITFDSGGLALKPRQGMEEMKFDMCGAAAVIQAMSALAELDTPVRVTAVVGAAENLPSGRAMKPGDIVRALDGTTIEINNPDAEGRLVLADCLTYARQQGCECLVDLATLTGGVVTALGSVYAGVLSNDEAWGELVRASGARSGDRVWPLPLDREYERMIEGQYAQLTNITERREAQAITAAELLHHFAGDVPWAHLDIAGTAYDVPRPYYVGKGATGFGVRLLVELARSAG